MIDRVRCEGILRCDLRRDRTSVYGIDVTVTNIQVQVSSGATNLANASVAPTLSISAYSSADAALVFKAATYIAVSELTVTMTVEFRDAGGNTGSVTSSFNCFACWDY